MSETPASAPSVRDVAALLAEIGVLMELTGQESFRARAFANAARALEGSDADLLALAREGRLTSLRGVGAGIAAVIAEIVLDGRSTLHDELQAATPLGLYDLLRIKGLGPKRIYTLHSRLGVDSLDALERAAREGRVARLPGFGEKTERKILEGIDFARASGRLRRYPEALELGVRLLEWLRALPEVQAAELVGGIRRRMEVVDRIDLVAACTGAETLLRSAQELQGVAGVGEDGGDEVRLELNDGVIARMRCVPPEDFLAAVVWETGSAAHVEQLAERASSQGGSFDASGLVLDGSRVHAERETELYERLGLAYVPPEMREGLGEVEAAATAPFPRLVEESDLTGTFHCHSTYSDGKASVEEMAHAARAKGWSYLGLADHSRTAAYAGGLSIERVAEQHAEIDLLNAAWAAEGPSFRLLKGIESDILPDGNLDYPDDVLASFDFVVGSVHSSFGMPGEEMTRRMIRAVRHPALTILGHPAGRLLLTRDGYALDLRAVLEEAAERGVVVEINANPHRLDLDWREVRYAARLGILIAINPDAHSVAALDHVAFGVNMARKAGLEPRQVLNTWPLEEVLEYLAKRKEAAQRK